MQSPRAVRRVVGTASERGAEGVSYRRFPIQGASPPQLREETSGSQATSSSSNTFASFRSSDACLEAGAVETEVYSRSAIAANIFRIILHDA